jgi:hypothetical protein
MSNAQRGEIEAGTIAVVHSAYIPIHLVFVDLSHTNSWNVDVARAR